MIDWQKIFTEYGLLAPSEVGCKFVRLVNDNLWVLEKHVYAYVYENSTVQNPLVKDYLWAPNDTIALWMLSNVIQQGLPDCLPEIETINTQLPNLWPTNIFLCEPMEDVYGKLVSQGVECRRSEHYSVATRRSVGKILHFERSRLYFWTHNLENPSLIGFAISVHNPLFGRS